MQVTSDSPGIKKIKMPLGLSQALATRPVTSLCAGFSWEDVVLKVSLVGDVSSWEVSGHHI